MRRFLAVASTTPALCIALAVMALLMAVVFPALPIGGPSLDGMAGYSYAEALAALESYGREGRRLYALSSVNLDTLLIASYASFFGGLAHRLRPSWQLWKLLLLPLAAAACDLGENIQVIVMLTRYPELSAIQVAAASLFTSAKMIAFLLSLAMLGLLAAGVVIGRLRSARVREAGEVPER